MRLEVKAYSAGKALISTLFDGQGECGSTDDQAEEVEEVLHIDVVEVGSSMLVLEIVCWLAVMVVFSEILLCSGRGIYI
jgi:hypothetical protein